MKYRVVVSDLAIVNVDPRDLQWIDDLMRTRGPWRFHRQEETFGYVCETNNSEVAGAWTALSRGEIARYRTVIDGSSPWSSALTRSSE